ncbi:endonuclease/exonuclease/phosphatase family protein [Streptomyces sp. NPDC012888]|uniref:endonuclease/exonuclease/phosphatase family protein n=1 Tax=Streptomyces sp. NPDC012888 TaxID=3364855 RepID=UPI00368BBAB1
MTATTARAGAAAAGAPAPLAPARRTPTRTRTRTRRRVWAWGVGGAGVLLALVMLLHDRIPNRPGNLGSLVETFLPWTGVPAVLLLAAAAVFARRPRAALVCALLPAVVWAGSFGPALTRGGGTAAEGPGGFTVVSHNVDDANPDPEGTARALAASGAQLIALQELVQPAVRTYQAVLAASHPYHEVRGTVGIWSTHPLRDTRAVPVMPWTRALRTTADTPGGPVTVYVAHLASVRIRPSAGFATGNRDAAAARLAAELEAGPPGRTVLVGDFNGTTGDRAMAAVFSGFRPAQREAGSGFGFSWPAAFPVARIDHVLVRGLDPVAAWTLPATASDHLPVAARLRHTPG